MANIPSITGISPATFDDGRSVTLTGSGLAGASVSIGGVAQTVTASSDSSLTFTAVRGGSSLGACRVDVVAAAGVGGGNAALGWSAAALAAGNTLTITTDGTYNFGATGPTVVVYDDFSGGTAGGTIDNTGTIGSWNSNVNSTPIFADNGRDGSTCFNIYNSAYEIDASSLALRQKLATFTQASEIFVCYATKWPSGVTGSGTPNTWPSSSHWKGMWAYFGATGYSADGVTDFCLPSHNGSGGVIVGGNETGSGGANCTISGAGKDIGNYNFSGWNLYQLWVKGGADPSVDNSTVYVGFSNANYFGEQTVTSVKVFATGSDYVDRVSVPGWCGNLDSFESGFGPVYDDVYIATGAGAAARVMLGDAATWSACRELWVAPPTAWGASSISCRIPRTPGGVAGMYVYVLDATNTLMSSNGVQL